MFALISAVHLSSIGGSHTTCFHMDIQAHSRQASIISRFSYNPFPFLTPSSRVPAVRVQVLPRHAKTDHSPSLPPSPTYFNVHSLARKVINHLRGLAESKFPGVKEAKFVEWWAHRRPHSSGHQMHFDSDNEGRGGVRNPIIRRAGVGWAPSCFLFTGDVALHLIVCVCVCSVSCVPVRVATLALVLVSVPFSSGGLPIYSLDGTTLVR